MVIFLALTLLEVEMRMIRSHAIETFEFLGWLDRRPLGQRSKTKPKT
jgi:hypothetical protein